MDLERKQEFYLFIMEKKKKEQEELEKSQQGSSDLPKARYLSEADL